MLTTPRSFSLVILLALLLSLILAVGIPSLVMAAALEPKLQIPLCSDPDFLPS